MSDKLCGLAGLGLDNLEDMDILDRRKGRTGSGRGT